MDSFFFVLFVCNLSLRVVDNLVGFVFIIRILYFIVLCDCWVLESVLFIINFLIF